MKIVHRILAKDGITIDSQASNLRCYCGDLFTLSPLQSYRRQLVGVYVKSVQAFSCRGRMNVMSLQNRHDAERVKAKTINRLVSMFVVLSVTAQQGEDGFEIIFVWREIMISRYQFATDSELPHSVPQPGTVY